MMMMMMVRDEETDLVQTNWHNEHVNPVCGCSDWSVVTWRRLRTSDVSVWQCWHPSQCRCMCETCHMWHSINQSINQSKQIYIAPCVVSESEARDGGD